MITDEEYGYWIQSISRILKIFTFSKKIDLFVLVNQTCRRLISTFQQLGSLMESLSVPYIKIISGIEQLE